MLLYTLDHDSVSCAHANIKNRVTRKQPNIKLQYSI